MILAIAAFSGLVGRHRRSPISPIRLSLRLLHPPVLSGRSLRNFPEAFPASPGYLIVGI